MQEEHGFITQDLIANPTTNWMPYLGVDLLFLEFYLLAGLNRR